jgi:hypothetical protein
MDYGEIIQVFFLQVVFPILSAAVLGLVGWLTKKLADKFGEEAIMSHKVYIETNAIAAIGYAEERAMEWAKEQNKITGREKLDMAIGWFIKQIPEISKEQAEQLIISALARIKNVGATDEKVVNYPE